MYGFDHAKVRPATCRLLDMMDEGVLDPRTVADMALSWLSEQSVKEMMLANDLVETEDEEISDEDAEAMMDDFNYVGSRHHY